MACHVLQKGLFVGWADPRLGVAMGRLPAPRISVHMDDGRRDQALMLLESNHRFPGPYEFRVVVRAEGVSSVVSALAAALARPSRVDERRSGSGRWVSVHYAVEISAAAEVLDVYDLLREMDQVVLAL